MIKKNTIDSFVELMNKFSDLADEYSKRITDAFEEDVRGNFDAASTYVNEKFNYVKTEGETEEETWTEETWTDPTGSVSCTKRVSKVKSSVQAEIDELKAKMEALVKEQNYEDAIKLRDQLRDLEAKL